MERQGIDISKYQGTVDFDQLKAEGKTDFVMIRAVSTNKSGLYIDPYFERNYAECKRVGLPCGVYYYTYADSKAAADAELRLLRKALEGKAFEYPVAVDVEENTLKPLGAAALTELVAYAAKEIERWGCYAMVYTYTYYHSTALRPAMLAGFDLWIADYRGQRPGVSHGIWQHSSRGRAAGITGYVDRNIAYKDYPAIIAAAGLNNLTGGKSSAEDKPAADAEPGTVVAIPLYVISSSPVTAGDAAALEAAMGEAARRLGNIEVCRTEV